ncbi:aminoglycoside adenylyltransferase family protein [Streptomyces umbrinus]|uniref:aminoglycoside adenylyltransferase family protein n=1 Tax=Streptomyces umbrinus TaxID=67370 RepID=UPI0027D8ADD6|nr:aminoglycoside adenylyltransferase family protein [Streptomyces umbrinus]
MSDHQAQLDQVLRLVHDVLGAEVAGVCLHGSAVLGGLRPDSDLDVFVVARRRMTDRERRNLLHGLLGISGRGARNGEPARPVELIVVAQGDVRPWRYPPRCEFLYGEWLREEFERGEVPAPAVMPDLAPVITMVLLGDTPLFGPPPARLLDPVPHEDLRRATVAGVPELLAGLESDTRNVLLTLARVWMTLATGTVTSKDAAASWALDRLPARHRPVLARARSLYLGGRDSLAEPADSVAPGSESWDGEMLEVRGHADLVVRAIEQLAARDGH